MTKIICSLLLAGLIWLLGATGCAVHDTAIHAIQVQQRDWNPAAGFEGVELLSEHYQIRVTARDPLLRESLGVFMETAFGCYAEVLPPQREPERRLPIYLFEIREQWAAFTRAFVPERAHTYLHIQDGGYLDQSTATAVTFDIGRDRTLALLAHEGWHQYWAGHFTSTLPAWLNEGLATQFEAFVLSDGRPRFTPRDNYLRKNNLREALANDGAGLIPIPRLLSMDAGHAVRETGQVARSYYAQVWSLLLFLRDPASGYADGVARLLSDSTGAQLARSIRAYRAATPGSDALSDGEVAFAQYIEEDMDKFVRRYREFAARLVH